MRRRGFVQSGALAWIVALGGCASQPGLRATSEPAMASATRATPVANHASAAVPSGALRVRVEAVADAFRARAAQPVAERWVTFLPVAGSDVLRVRSAHAACLGFVAVGRESLADVDLALHNESGARIAEDTHPDAHPYVRACLHAGETIYVVVRAGRGAGEVAVLTVANPPVVPPNLDEILGLRSSGVFAAPRPARVAIGNDPAVAEPARALDDVVDRLLPLGYRRVRTPLEGRLEQRAHDRRTVRLDAGRCYAVAAAGGDGVEDLELAVLSPDGRLLDQDRGEEGPPLLKFCAAEPGDYTLDVHMRAGEGAWAGAVLAMDPAIELAGDVAGVERVRALELAGDGRRHGMELLAPPVRGAAAGGEPLVFPVRLRAGHCYLFGAAADAFIGVNLSLVDDHGAVVASDTGQGPLARVYQCPSRTMAARVEATGVGGRGEFLFLMLATRGTPL